MNSEPQREQKNWFEWLVFAISLVLVLALVGYLCRDIWTARSGPPDIEITLSPASKRSGHYVVPVTVTNRGYESAEAVHLEVTLKKKSGEEERAEVELQFLPRGSTRRAVVTFESDPAEAEVSARVLGHRRP